MNSRKLWASILTTCALAAGFIGMAPVAEAAPAAQSLLASGKGAGNSATQIDYRGGRPQIYLPIGPSYLYYDYPYYYSRGYYPTHIGPGYVFYGNGGEYRSGQYPKYGGRCAHWHRKCVAHWGRGNDNYDGCMEYHRCE